MVSYWNTSVLLTPWILFGFTFPCFRIRAAEFIKSLGLSKFDFYLRNGRWKQARKKNQTQNKTESTMPKWDTPMSILKRLALEGAAGKFSQVGRRFTDSRGRTGSRRHASGNWREGTIELLHSSLTALYMICLAKEDWKTFYSKSRQRIEQNDYKKNAATLENT